MAAISWGNRIRDYLITKGIGSPEATNIQTMVNRMTTAFASVTEDSGLILMVQNNIRPIMDIARAVYGSGIETSQSSVATWIAANYPNIPGAIASFYSYIIATDLNTNLVGSAAMITAGIPTEVYIETVGQLLSQVTRFMRHFAGATIGVNNVQLVPPLPEVIPT